MIQLIQKGKEAGFDHDFLINARRINSGMPAYTVKMMQNTLNTISLPVKGTRIVLLGLSYKANVADDRESPSYQVLKRLQNKEADLVVYDPYFPEQSDASSLPEALEDAQCVFLCTNHDEFIMNQELYKDIPIVIDGRNCLDKETIEKNGSIYRGIGIR
jgi:UDP-N-acetyl-D-glucosamine dehydrogenase